MEPFLQQNSTLPWLEERRDKYTMISTSIVGILIFLSALLGNLAVVFVSFVDETLKAQDSNLLIVNLALMDFFTALFEVGPNTMSIILDGWPWGKFLCSFQGCIYIAIAITTIWTITMISYDRGTAILRPLHYSNAITKKHILAMVAFSWFAGAVSIIPPAALDYIVYNYWEAACYLKVEGTAIYLGIAILIDFIIPSTIIVYYNARIILSTSKMKQNIVEPNSKQAKNADSNSKVVRSILILIGVYFGCFIPFVFFKCVTPFVDKLEAPKEIVLWVSMFQFLSSSVNPFLYAILRKDYRYAFKKLPRYFLNIFQCG